MGGAIVVLAGVAIFMLSSDEWNVPYAAHGRSLNKQKNRPHLGIPEGESVPTNTDSPPKKSLSRKRQLMKNAELKSAARFGVSEREYIEQRVKIELDEELKEKNAWLNEKP